jgi:hypothetical protein
MIEINSEEVRKQIRHDRKKSGSNKKYKGSKIGSVRKY